MEHSHRPEWLAGLSEAELERLRDEYEERAAILEFDAGYQRWRAEAVARHMVYGPYRRRKQ